MSHCLNLFQNINQYTEVLFDIYSKSIHSSGIELEILTVGQEGEIGRTTSYFTDSPIWSGQSPATSESQPEGKVPGHGNVTPENVPTRWVSNVLAGWSIFLLIY